ncbi:N-acetyltransferase [Pseudophaeobacter arcticus]|jgi:GNAT superfamily N-acetyltransferase|uniref:N-acetyltransferase n=1 Tax=Pseudophaeobacter arcticus TaxID=385492 RepID=UPI0039E35891
MTSKDLGEKSGTFQELKVSSRQQERSDSHLKVDVFQAATHEISLKDLPLLQELTVGVFWPHRDRDLEMLVKLGQGYLVLDEIGRPLSSAMKFEMGPDLAMLGMMITAPRLQTLGTGRWLLQQIMQDCGSRDMRLSATRAGYRLYKNAGFEPVATIRQQQGIARQVLPPAPLPHTDVRAIDDADWVALLELDLGAYGGDRKNILQALQAKSDCVVAERAGQIVGYAMIRNFGRGQVIGPVVADSDRLAIQLIAPLIEKRSGAFLRMDTPAEEGELTNFLSAAGLGLYDTVTEMCLGKQRRATSGAVVYGLAAHSLG